MNGGLLSSMDQTQITNSECIDPEIYKAKKKMHIHMLVNPYINLKKQLQNCSIWLS